MTEQEKKDLGLWYDANYDPNIRKAFMRGNELAFRLNQISPSKTEERVKILKELFGSYHESAFVLSPFYCDYGYNISLGEKSFLNHNVYLMDCAPITIGSHVFIGPSCGFYTAIHAYDYRDRNLGLERTEPITVEDNVWIGGDVTVLPGVTIGEGSIIGAKSLVNKDIPKGVIAAGNPCKVIRKLTEEDRLDPEIREFYHYNK